MRERILAKLHDIEMRHGVHIFYACESGSRAWGFASEDSDFDVRFLYAHPIDWYLSVAPGRDVIEEPIVDDLDVNGWDLRKAMWLLWKSNPPLLEWLGSPIVYKETGRAADMLRRLMPEFYSPAQCMHHYLHMAQGNLREYLQGPEIWTKKYFYVLRPVLACQWLERGFGIVPTEFDILVDRLTTGILREEIGRLLEAKMAGSELRRGPRNEVISGFVESEVARFEAMEKHGARKRTMSDLDAAFRGILRYIWEGR